MRTAPTGGRHFKGLCAPLLAIGIACLPASGVGAQAVIGNAPLQSGQAARWQVAITIDDVPLSSRRCDAAEVAAVNDSMLRILARYAVPATGFVVPGTTCQGDGEAGALAIARRWRAAGHVLGNHSHTHRDYNSLSVAEYLADLDRAHQALEGVLDGTGQRERWFRAPQLHMGDSRQKVSALDTWMDERGYQNGVVTIDNQEWVFAAAYLRHVDNALTADRIRTAYLEHLGEAIQYSRALSRQLFDREIPQVLLLHANRLNADHLDAVLALIREEGGEFVSLAAATADPVYHEARSRYVGPRGLSWLLRWAAAEGAPAGPEPREPGWIQRLASGS